MAQLCLGTVQFGMKYGVNNKYGQPSKEECFEMFDIALNNGINKIDTAMAYGTAEELLGEYISKRKVTHKVEVISKLRPNILEIEKKSPQEVVQEQVIQSLVRLHLDELDGYLLHTPEYIYNENVLDGLMNIKAKGYVNKIGVSIYEIKDGFAAIDTGIIDYIQLPYSIFDQRGMNEGFLEKAKQNNIEIYCRSAFLQGLILMPEEDIPMHLSEAKEYLRIFYHLLNEFQINPIDGILHYVYDNEYVDYLVFGVDKKEQLIENIDRVNNTSISKEFRVAVDNELQGMKKSIILPSLWKK